MANADAAGLFQWMPQILDEVVKFREDSYAHAFATLSYHREGVLPAWAGRHLENNRSPVAHATGLEFKRLQEGSTGDATWDAMQGYLVDTGELHNN